jgi:hypothetical protein
MAHTEAHFRYVMARNASVAVYEIWQATPENSPAHSALLRAVRALHEAMDGLRGDAYAVAAPAKLEDAA